MPLSRCLRPLFATLLVTAGASTLDIAARGETESGGNLLRNPRFEQGMQDWDLGLWGNAAASARIDQAAGPPGDAGKALSIEISRASTVFWHVQLLQKSVALLNGDSYSFSFLARSDRPRQLRPTVYIGREGYYAVGLSAMLNITPAWKRYSVCFTALGADRAGQNWVCFTGMGTAPGIVELADTSLRQMAGPVPIAPALLAGDVRIAGAPGWEGANGSAAGDLSVIRSELPAGLSGSGARFQLAEPGPVPWTRELRRVGLRLRPSAEYLLAFWARSDVVREVRLILETEGPDPHDAGLNGRMELTPEWRKFRIEFCATPAGANSERLLLQAGGPAGYMDIAGVSLAEAANPISGRTQSAMRPGSAFPLIGSWQSSPDRAGLAYRIEFNSDGTGTVDETARAARGQTPPIAPAAHPFRWYVRPSGHRIVLSGKVWRWAISGGRRRLILTDSHGKQHALRRL